MQTKRLTPTVLAMLTSQHQHLTALEADPAYVDLDDYLGVLAGAWEDEANSYLTEEQADAWTDACMSGPGKPSQADVREHGLRLMAEWVRT